jgi:hypothetical protein
VQFLQENTKVRNFKCKTWTVIPKEEKNMTYLRTGYCGECFYFNGSDRKLEKIT